MSTKTINLFRCYQTVNTRAAFQIKRVISLVQGVMRAGFCLLIQRAIQPNVLAIGNNNSHRPGLFLPPAATDVVSKPRWVALIDVIT